MRSGILGADRGLEWHRAVAPVVEVGEFTTHGLALSRPRRGFESRWGHQIVFVEVLREGFPSLPRRGRKALVRSATIQLARPAAVCFGDALRGGHTCPGQKPGRRCRSGCLPTLISTSG